jgi:branched-chain amino acid transport system ATP-binding protein
MTAIQDVGVASLQVSNLTKRYGAMEAIKDLSFHVQQNEILGVSGPNGAGKTTLFDVISGLSAPSAGRVTLFGQDITGRRAEQICHMGLSRTFQLNAVFDSLTVEENLLVASYFGQRNRSFPGLRFDRKSQEDCSATLEIVGLADHRHRAAAALTVLERKLLMLASAIATRPRLLMLDEPVGGLNRDEIGRCADVIRRIRDERGMTIIVIEHVMSFITAIADRMMVLHHGAKLYEGSISGMAASAEVVSTYLGTSGLRDLTKAVGVGHDAHA